jgi:hypothetical protein
VSSSYSANKAVRSESVRGAVGRQPRPTCDVVLGASRLTAIADTGKVGRATIQVEGEEGVCAMIASVRDADEAAPPTAEDDDEEAFPSCKQLDNRGVAEAVGERRGALLIGTTARSQLGTLRFGAIRSGPRSLWATAEVVTLVESGATKLELNG